MTIRPLNVHENYHAHVYYDESSSRFAKALCSDIAERFGLEVGRFHDKPIGPHPRWSCQIKFSSSDFDRFIPWLDQNRNDLTVLVHGLTGDDLSDHTDHAYWLGEEAALKLDMFRDK